VSGRTAESKDISLVDSVESSKAKVVNIGDELLATVERYMDWVSNLRSQQPQELICVTTAIYFRF
jgi:hypothetical protein